MIETNTLPQNDPLWQRLQQYQFEDTNSSPTFSARLARENGWTAAYTSRVLNEYIRFTYLAVKAGHHVTPSDQVDQAWHLHIVHTRKYTGFCENVLQQKLEHDPTDGTIEEQKKFEDWYEKTLLSYKTFFGSEPPPDVWPSTSKAGKLSRRRVIIAMFIVVGLIVIGYLCDSGMAYLAAILVFVSYLCYERAMRGGTGLNSTRCGSCGAAI